jgi:phage baseplate assembly protein W
MAEVFLGKGLKFPITVDAEGGLATADSEDKVRESVLLVLGTSLGERQMRPEFGSRIQDQVFAALRPATMNKLAFNVQEALIQWEPRIQVERVQVTPDPANDGLLLVSIDYKVRATNTAFNLVYPFFISGFGSGT